MEATTSTSERVEEECKKAFWWHGFWSGVSLTLVIHLVIAVAVFLYVLINQTK